MLHTVDHCRLTPSVEKHQQDAMLCYARQQKHIFKQQQQQHSEYSIHLNGYLLFLGVVEELRPLKVEIPLPEVEQNTTMFFL